MTAIASKEIRQRAITAYESGHGSQEYIASLFQINTRTFQKWLAAYRKDGRLSALSRGHQQAAFSGENFTALDQYVDAHVDASLEEIREAFSDRVICSIMAIHNTLKRLGWVRKKSGYVRMNEIGQI